MTEDIFENAAAARLHREAPLARRVAPRTLDDLLGQEQILGPGKILRRAIEADRITSLILYGPPGSGKTALARIIALFLGFSRALLLGVAVYVLVSLCVWVHERSGSRTAAG